MLDEIAKSIEVNVWLSIEIILAAAKYQILAVIISWYEVIQIVQ
jgi:hypothetical protein